jgi:hypothetical protein
MNLFKLQKKSKKNYMKLLSMIIGASRTHFTNKIKKGRFTRHTNLKVTSKNN